MNPLTYIHNESVRQSATVREMGGMCEAYRYLVVSTGVPVSETMIRELSHMITGNVFYRNVPAVFNQGLPAMPAGQIPNVMPSLVEAINHDISAGTIRNRVEMHIKEFLLIHPFVDGNGRVASLLRNYLLGTLDDPTPLPDYFGEN